MARIRYLKPEFPEDTKLARVSRDARLLYCQLWCWMDKQGLVEHDPMVIKKNVFPYDEDMTAQRVSVLIGELQGVGRLQALNWNGVDLLYCPTLRKHQKFHRDEKPKYTITQEQLKELGKQHPVSTLLPMTDATANSTGNGELVTGNGQPVTGNCELGTGNGQRTVDPEIAKAQAALDAKRRALNVNPNKAWNAP